MAIQNVITITVDETSTDADRALMAETGYRELAGSKLLNYMKSLISGRGKPVVRTEVGAVKASGTFTLVDAVATDVVIVNGISYTAVASGATGDQWNIGADDDADAVNLAATINADADQAGILTAAASAGGIVTITAARPGLIGNAITIASSDVTITASAARLAGGVDGTSDKTHYYGSGA